MLAFNYAHGPGEPDVYSQSGIAAIAKRLLEKILEERKPSSEDEDSAVK